MLAFGFWFRPLAAVPCGFWPWAVNYRTLQLQRVDQENNHHHHQIALLMGWSYFAPGLVIGCWAPGTGDGWGPRDGSLGSPGTGDGGKGWLGSGPRGQGTGERENFYE